MPTCCAFGCTNSSQRGYKLYRFPTGKSNEIRRKVWLHWLQNIGGDKWKSNEHSKLCQVHFTEDQFENHRADKRRLLKPNAVPTLFSLPPQKKSKEPSKLQQNYVGFPKGNDQPCADTLGFPATESKVAQGYDQPCADTLGFPATESKVAQGIEQVYVDRLEFGVVKTEISSDNDDASMGTHELENEESEIAPGNGQAFWVTPKLEVAAPEIAPVPELLLTGNSKNPSNKDLIAENENLKRKLNLLQQKLHRQKHDNENLQERLSFLFTNDQVDSMKRGFNGKQVWSEETIAKAVRIYLACHSKGYNYLRESGYPLPSLRTLQRHIKNLL